MKKLTFLLDRKTAKWASARAAERNMNLSQLVDELLRERMSRSRKWRVAGMQRRASGISRDSR